MVGPTNTKYSQNGSNSSYCSKVEELLNYRLLELIRRNDYSGMDRGKIVESSHLFKSGDRFKMNDYINSGYFANIDRSSILNTKALMNNGKSLNWEIEFSTMNSEGALIKLTKTN